jgi:ABC-type transport system substrate-binding protein
MKDKTIVIISLLIASLMLSIAPAFAFYHPSTGLEDNMFENFGPRIDRILVKMYGTLDAEIAALQAGEIDITDWPLTKTMITTLSADPNVVVLGYGGEAGEYEINFNNNNNQYLGNPPNPAAPNPVYQNPGSSIPFRQAVSTSINNTFLCTVLAEG